MAKERIAIYIDGSNFYKYLKNKEVNFPKGVKFDFLKFVNFLIKGNICVSKRYYVGIAKNFDNTDKSKEIVKGQQKFLSKIKKEGFCIKPGRLIYDQGRIREKGTDVKIAADLIIGAVNDLYDVAILVSSDTDLIPAIKYVKYKKKTLKYVGFSHNPSLTMKRYADDSILLSLKDINSFKK